MSGACFVPTHQKNTWYTCFDHGSQWRWPWIPTGSFSAQGPVTSTSTSTETISSVTATMTSTTINGTTSSTTGSVTMTTGFATTLFNSSGDVPDGGTTPGGEPLDDYVPVETWMELGGGTIMRNSHILAEVVVRLDSVHSSGLKWLM